MDRGARKDLLETIEQLKKELNQYKGSFKDVVHAYKNLRKEKEALEASVQALSDAPQPGPQATNQGTRQQVARGDHDGDGGSKEDEEESVDSQSTRDESKDGSDTESTDKDEVSPSHLHLKDQLSTLTTALATVTAQKSKMEASFQADKKKLRHEFEETQRQHQESRDNFEEEIARLQEQITEGRNTLRLQQQQREQEQSDSAMMMRELQALVAQERGEKERLENKLCELEDGLAIAQSQPDKSAAYEEHVRCLTRETESLRGKLRAAEEKVSRPSPLLLQLQKEMAEMKAQHRMQVESEQQKGKDLKEILRQFREAKEIRIATLESKLTELSEVVGNYDRVKQQDHQAISRLKERIVQLDLENTALAKAANKSQSDEPANTDATVSELSDRIAKLKGLMKLANQNSEKPVDIDDVCNIEDHTSLEGHPDHRTCQQELKQLKDEFERYKLRAQGILKNKTVKDSSSNKEIETLQSQTSEMRERVSVLRQQLDDEEANHKQTTTNYEDKIFHLKEQHRAALSQAEAEYKQRASDMEQQLHRQRDRTMALLAEKAQETDSLRQQLNNRYDPTTMKSNFSPTSRHSSSDVFTEGEERSYSEADETVSQLQVSMVQSSNPTLLHFAEEHARKEVELAAVKKQKQQLEGALRELQEKHAMAAQAHEEQLDEAHTETERWKRNRSREGTNLEYLKNVVLCYLQTDNHSNRQQMFNAIATILQFTRREKEGVLKKQDASWWGYAT